MRAQSSELRHQWPYLLGILGVGFLTRVPFILSAGFFSDESVYTYAAYSILQGNTPYVQIMLPHPPLGYLGIAGLVLISDGSLAVLRAAYLLLFLTTGVLTYLLFTMIRKVGAFTFNPLVAVAMLVVYPIPYSLTTPLEFILFEIPVLISTLLLVRGLLSKNLLLLLGSGAFLTLALMIWYPAIFVAFSTVTFALVYSFRKYSWRVAIKLTLCMIVGGFVVVGVALGLIADLTNFHNFVVQTITLQSGLRSGFTLDERVRHILLSVEEFLPLIILGAVGALEIVRRTVKEGRDILSLLPLWIYITNFALISTIPKFVLSHYFAYLTPFLSYLASGPIETLVRRVLFSSRVKVPSFDFYKSIVAIAMIAVVIVVPLYTLPHTAGFVSTNPYTLAEQTVGVYVGRITGPSDKIWTSEGAIAYFSSRLIEPSASQAWPLQAEYNDVFNASYVDSDGVTQRGIGIASPASFQQGWSSHRTRVLLFILNPGPIPYPDEFLWNGFNNTAGVQSYVQTNYHLNATFTFANVDYVYNVWVIN